MTQTTIPDKLYFKIGEVAKMADVPPHVLRYWETEFVAIRPKRANSKQRLYRRKDVELILNIKSLLHHQGYTIAGAKKFLESGEAIPRSFTSEPQVLASPPQVGDSDLPQRLKALKTELKELQKILQGKEQ